VEIRHRGGSPSVAPDAYIAPTAVLSGRIRVGSGSCVLHGAVLTDDGGPVDVGASCVIMEHAVVRGTPRHPVTIGDHVLAGPHSYLTGWPAVWPHRDDHHPRVHHMQGRIGAGHAGRVVDRYRYGAAPSRPPHRRRPAA